MTKLYSVALNYQVWIDVVGDGVVGDGVVVYGEVADDVVV